VLGAHRPQGTLTLDTILEADRWARARLHEAAANVARG